MASASQAEPARTFGHMAFNFRPGEGPAAAKFFELIGCRVHDNGPVNAGGSLYTVIIDPDTATFADNMLFLSPAAEAQLAFEAAMVESLGFDQPSEHPQLTAYRAMKLKEPEMFFHGALRYRSLSTLEAAVTAVAAAAETDPDLQGRLSITRFRAPSGVDPRIDSRIAASTVFRVDDRPSFVPGGVQVFVHTDLFAGGLLAFGQSIELDFIFPHYVGKPVSL